MYQHHIQLKTATELSSDQAIAWYKTVKSYGPENVVYNYDYKDGTVALEYGTCDCNEQPNVYTVPLTRDLTADEAMIIVAAWEYQFAEDFDIEISNMYNVNTDYEFDINEDANSYALNEMGKWHHNRWVAEMAQKGWRWGPQYSTSKQTHPALKDWDRLPESFRRTPEFSKKEITEWLTRLL